MKILLPISTTKNGVNVVKAKRASKNTAKNSKANPNDGDIVRSVLQCSLAYLSPYAFKNKKTLNSRYSLNNAMLEIIEHCDSSIREINDILRSP